MSEATERTATSAGALARRGDVPAPVVGGGQLTAKRPQTPARYVEFLPDVEAVANRRHSPYARWLVLSIAALFAFAVAWAALAKVERYATAPGQVRPDGRVKVVNHPFGGTITEILVDEGDLVEAGQVLFRLDPEFVESQMSGVRGQWLSALATVARLEAEASGGEPNFPEPVLDEAPEVAMNQLDLYEARQAALASARQRADQIVNQRREAIANIDAQIEKLRGSLAIVSQQEQAVATLVEQDYFPQLRYLSLLREVEELRADIAGAESERLSAEAALDQAIAERTSIDDDRMSEVFASLTDHRAQAETLASQLALSLTEQARLTVRAPERGIVQNLIITNLGQSVAPNEPLLNIVPVGETLIIEASVSNSDIGFVEVGMPADVKIATYDFITYGSLPGVVSAIAPDATVDPTTGIPYFKIWVRTERTYLGNDPDQYPVLPGMQTTVDLLLGERTILDYLTERVTRTTSEAFTER